MSTVAILAQGTSLADAFVQAFCACFLNSEQQGRAPKNRRTVMLIHACRGFCIAALNCYPSTADSASFYLLCCQPVSVRRSSRARISQLAPRNPCTLSACLGQFIRAACRAYKHVWVVPTPLSEHALDTVKPPWQILDVMRKCNALCKIWRSNRFQKNLSNYTQYCYLLYHSYHYCLFLLHRKFPEFFDAAEFGRFFEWVFDTATTLATTCTEFYYYCH